MQPKSFAAPLATILLGSLLATAGAAEQSLPAASVSIPVPTAPAPRITSDWRSSAAVVIAHSKPPFIAPATDLGAAPSSQILSRMLLLLAPAPAQQQALAAELMSLQDSSAPNYHRWLTPQAFAQSYSNSPSDVAAVEAWLESEGFTVAPLPAGLGWIEFSGTVAQVEQAFGARIDTVTTAYGTRAVLTSGISIPGALAPVIAGLVSLDGVLSAPALTTPQPLGVSASNLAALTSPANAAALTPQLIAQLLDLAPLMSAGVNGAGETIAMVSRSDVNSADVAAFRSAFGLPASQLSMVVNGADPGFSDDQAEVTLAASWAGAAAPDARILLAPAATTSATDGVDLSLAGLIDRDLANVVAVGYSACEAALSSAHQAFYAALYQQAAAEGITVIAASGDSGAAACTAEGGTAPVSTGLAVNALASMPWNTVVGVAGYGTGGAAAGNTALAAWSPMNPADPAYAGGGGSSTLYARQIWQPASTQLDAGATTQHRLLPDLALPTAIDSSSNPGLAFCLSASASTPASGCTLMRSGGSGAATAIFAGVAALIDQRYGAQGNLAPELYATSQSPAASGVFNDVAQGSAQLPCVPGSSGCGAGGQIGYTAASGYDLATGLGVPDVQKLVTHLVTSTVTVGTLNFTLSITPTQANNTYNPSALVSFTATVVDNTRAGIPTGTVTLYNTANFDTLAPAATLVSSGSTALGSSAAFTLEPSNFYNYAGAGSFNLGIYYTSSGTYASGPSGYINTVTSELSPMVLAIAPSTNSPALGSTLTVTVTATIASSGPPAGSVPPSGAVTLYVNGTALTPVALSASGSGAWTAVFSYQVTATSNSIYAYYPGDSNYNGASSPVVTITVAKAAVTVTLTANYTAAQLGAAVILAATVTPTTVPAAGAEQNPSGTVIFYDGTTVIGTGTLTPAPSGDSSTAALTIQTLPAGTDSLTAAYQGDSSYGIATSNLLPISIQGFTLTPSPNNPPTNLNMTLGGSGSESFVITGVGGYSSPVQVICTVPAQDDMSCQTSPQVVIPTATVTFVVQSYITGGPANARLDKPRLPRQQGPSGPMWPQEAGGAALAALVFFLLPFGGRARTFLRQGPRRFLVLLMLLAGLLGTGIGCTSTGVTLAPIGTPLGVSTLQVTATAYVDNAVVSQSVYFTANVQAP